MANGVCDTLWGIRWAKGENGKFGHHVRFIVHIDTR